MKKWLFLLFYLGYSLTGSADFAAGEEAFQAQRYSEAFQQFLPLADEGDYRAQYYVGYLYLHGLGVNKNDTKGLSYLNESLKKDYHSAQAEMAFLYSQGQAVPMDKRKAIELYKKAADQNNTNALLNLGVAYYQGDGVTRNISKAIEYLEKIQIDERPVAGRYLGTIYTSSEANDTSRAMNAYRTAAEAGDLPSYMAMGQMLLNGTNGSPDVKRALQYYIYAASQGYVPAQYTLGILYANGTQVERNPVLAHAWFSWAANQKYEPAVTALKQLKSEMTISEIDRARQEFINIQKNVMGKTDSPFKQERAVQSAIQAKKAESVIRRPRR